MTKRFILLFTLALSAGMMYAQDPVEIEDFALTEETIAEDTLLANTDSMAIEVEANPDPEWYVAPLDYDSVMARHNAPRRAAAANCPIDSVRIFDADSVLTAVTIYEYGDTTRTIEWTVKPDGTRIGKSKQEDASDALTTYTATYDWDANTNDWKGTLRTDNVFNESKKNTSRTMYTWINNAWTPQTRYTYDYDSDGRQKEILTYTRDANTNELVLSNGIYYTWYNSSKKTLDINYTAYSNGAWTAGTKKEYKYDANGNQSEYTYYSSLSNGNWIGSTHEVWTYNAANKKTYYEKQTWSNNNWKNSTKELWEYDGSGKLTLHEKFAGSSEDWTITLREIKGYDAAGNNDLIENYSFTNGVKKGTKKEEYTFNASKKKTLTIRYKWSNNEWGVSYKIVDNFDAAGNEIETANYNWTNDNWVGVGTRTLKSYNSSKKMTEQITQTWPTNSTDWVNSTRKTIEYSGIKTTQEATFIWSQDAWVGSTRSDWHYNAAGLNDTTKTYTNNGLEWIYSDRTINTFNTSGTNIMTHISHWDGSVWLLVSMTRIEDEDKINEKGIHEVLHAEWKCGSDSVWIGVKKDTTAYSSTNKKLYEARCISWANNDWVPSYKIEYEYNAKDVIAAQQRFEWKNDVWSGTYRYEYDYDAQGNQTVYATYLDWDSKNEIWIGSNKTESVFNQKNSVISSIFYTGQANTWLPVFRYLYTYDSSNREIEKTVEKNENSDWVYTEKYSKEFKGSVKVKDNTYLWLNGEWAFTSRYEDYYDSDAQAKIRREIRGSWNNGSLLSFSDKFYHYACDLASYTISFKNYDGTVLESKQVEEGKVPTYSGATPTKEATAEFSYTFSGWDKEVVAVTGEATYVASFTPTKNKYAITWLNDDNSQLDQKQVEYGEVPVYTGATPTKEATAEFSYTFAGWTTEPVAVTGEATYVASFTPTKNKYTITWLNDDNSQLDQTQVEYGEVPVYTGATPTKEATAEFSYTFAGWTTEPVAVTGEATYTASFTPTKNKYTITWLNDDNSQLSQTTVEYGEIPTYSGETPTKAATAEFTYTFTGWDKTVVAVTGDATYKATFSVTKNSYLITWLYDDGAEIDHQMIEYGTTPQPANPTKEATAQYTFTFTGWDKEITAVTGEATYTAVFDSVVNKYTVIFYYEDGVTELDRVTVEYGQTPSTSIVPSIQGDEHYTYEFAGWSPEIQPVTGEATYTATFTATPRTYAITFKNYNGVLLQTIQVAYGEVPVYSGETPSRPTTAKYTYVFSGWTPELTAVTGDATYTAFFEGVINTYTVIFYNEDGTELDRVEVEYGKMPTYTGETPTKAEDDTYTYTFAGWTPKLKTVTGDAAYTATYTASPKGQGLDQINDQSSATKVMINGTIYILRAGKTYTIDGVLVE